MTIVTGASMAAHTAADGGAVVAAAAAPSNEANFYIEQVVLASVAGLFLLLFLVQIQRERGTKKRAPVRSNTVPYKLHRAGALCCVIMLVVAIDPYGQHKNFGPATPSFLVAEVAVVLLYCFMTFAESLLELKYKASAGMIPGVPQKFHGRASMFFGGVGLALANTMYALAVGLNRWWWTLVFTTWAAIMFLASAVAIFTLSLLVKNKLIKVAKQLEDPDSEKGQIDDGQAQARKIRREAASMKRWGWAFLYYGVGMFIIYIRESVTRLDDREAPIYQPDLETLNWRDRVLPYTLWMGILLVFAYGWVAPLSQHKRHFADGSEESEEQEQRQEQKQEQYQYTGQFQGGGGMAGLLSKHQEPQQQPQEAVPDWMEAVQPQREAHEYVDDEYQQEDWQGDPNAYDESGYGQYEDQEAEYAGQEQTLLGTGVMQAGDPAAHVEDPHFE